MDHVGKASRRGGFTLVEVLASLLFLAIAVPAIVAALGLASRTSEVAARGSLAGELAENKLNEMLIDNTWQSAAQGNGDFGTNFPSYHWQLSTQTWPGGGNATGNGSSAASTPAPNIAGGNNTAGTTGTTSLTELSVKVFYPVQGGEHSVRLTTLVNPAATASPTPATTTGTSTTR